MPRKPPPRRTSAQTIALFVEAYVLNGGNATRAYQAAVRTPVKDTSAAVAGYRLLRNANVQEAVSARRLERFKALQMEGDEALALISARARANLAAAYDERGRLLPFHLWPETLQLAVRSLKTRDDGTLEPTLYDALKASELMAVATGKLKTNTMQVIFDHAGYLAGLDQPPKEAADGEGKDGKSEEMGLISSALTPEQREYVVAKGRAAIARKEKT